MARIDLVNRATGERLTPPPERILSVLERLPILEERRLELGNCVVCISADYTFGSVNDIPRNRQGGTKKAERTLAELRDSMLKVIRCINSMPIEAHGAFNVELGAVEERRKANEARGLYRKADRIFGLGLLEIYLFSMAETAERARRSVVASPQTKAPKPHRVAARRVASGAARSYWFLTGKPPTVTTSIGDGHRAGGRFLDLVAELFEALEIDASPETHARAAAKEFRAQKKPSKTPLAE